MSDRACDRIMDGINATDEAGREILAVLDPYNPFGTSSFVNFTTSKELLWETSPEKSHINYVVGDSEWELQFARAVEQHPKVVRYLKNQGLSFEIPYRIGGDPRRYIPDFIACIDDGHGEDDLLHLVVEVKGYRREDEKDKQNTMKTFWIPGVNHLGTCGRWAFAEFTDVWEMDDKLAALIDAKVAEMIENAGSHSD